MTSTFQPANALQAYLAPNLDLPQDSFENFYASVNQRERETGTIMNLKENATYSDREIINNQNWFTANPQVQRQAFRKVINFGALPNAAAKTVAHGITVDTSTSFTKIYAVATNPNAVDPAPFSIPIPFVDAATPNNNITLYVTNLNVYIETLVNYTAFTICYVVLEYLKN